MTDKVETLAAAWEMYVAEGMPGGEDNDQAFEFRQAFYAGAGSALGVFGSLTPADEKTPKQNTIGCRLFDEIMEFGEFVTLTNDLEARLEKSRGGARQPAHTSDLEGAKSPQAASIRCGVCRDGKSIGIDMQDARGETLAHGHVGLETAEQFHSDYGEIIEEFRTGVDRPLIN